MDKRIAKLQKLLKEENLDAIFITNQNNVTYLSGFTGLSQNERECFLIVTYKSSYLLTFPTYIDLFRNKSEIFKVRNITPYKRIQSHFEEIIALENIKILGYEKDNLTVSELEKLETYAKINFIGTIGLTEKLRVIKDESEIKSIIKAAEATDLAFQFIKSKLKKGLSEFDLALEIEYFLKHHSDGLAFSPIVAINKNSSIPHYLPSRNIKLENNSLILFDFGARIDNYRADLTRMVIFGKGKEAWIKTYLQVLSSQETAIHALKEGVEGDKIDSLARNYLISQNTSPYLHGLGHGVGIAIHEDPRLKIGSKQILKKDMVFTVEPGVYITDRYGIRIEDLIVLRSSGVEIISKSPKELNSIFV